MHLATSFALRHAVHTIWPFGDASASSSDPSIAGRHSRKHLFIGQDNYEDLERIGGIVDSWASRLRLRSGRAAREFSYRNARVSVNKEKTSGSRFSMDENASVNDLIMPSSFQNRAC